VTAPDAATTPRTSATVGASIDALRARITADPWRALAAAFALGAYAGAIQPRLPRTRIARDALALVGALALRAGRDVAARALLASARRWLGAPAA
jgi:hypothetical protein